MADRKQARLKNSKRSSEGAETLDANAPFASWLFLLAGLISGGLVIPTLNVLASQYLVQLPAQHSELLGNIQTGEILNVEIPDAEIS